MGDVVNGKDIHAVLVEAAIERADEVDAVKKDAEAVDAAAIVAEHQKQGDSESLVHELVRRAALASLRRLGSQQSMAVKQVKQEAQALKRQDPSKVAAVTDQHIADARADKMREKAGEEEK